MLCGFAACADAVILCVLNDVAAYIEYIRVIVIRPISSRFVV